jgi:flagellar basal body-associated protein FliL
MNHLFFSQIEEIGKAAEKAADKSVVFFLIVALGVMGFVLYHVVKKFVEHTDNQATEYRVQAAKFDERTDSYQTSLTDLVERANQTHIDLAVKLGLNTQALNNNTNVLEKISKKTGALPSLSN